MTCTRTREPAAASSVRSACECVCARLGHDDVAAYMYGRVSDCVVYVWEGE